jgi:hypothetical protein
VSIFDEVSGNYLTPRFEDLPKPPKSIWRSAQEGLSSFMDSDWGGLAEIPLTVVTAPQRAVEAGIGAIRGGFELSEAERKAFGGEAYNRDAAAGPKFAEESIFDTAYRRLRGRGYTAPGGGQIARETVAGAGELLGAPISAQVMGLTRDASKAGGYRPISETEQQAFEQESPTLSRFAAPARVATEFAGSALTDPTILMGLGPKLAGMGAKTIGQEAAQEAIRAAARQTAQAERLASRMFLPSAAVGAVGGTLEAGRAISEEGAFSPRAIEATLGAGLATGMGALAAKGATAKLPDYLPPAPTGTPAFKVEDKSTVVQEPQYAYRARNVGDKGIPAAGHAQASLSEADVRRMAPSRTDEPQEIVRVRLDDPNSHEIMPHPSGEKWVKFKGEIPEDRVEVIGELTDKDRAAASKAELLPEPQAKTIRDTVELTLQGDPVIQESIAAKTGLSPEQIQKGAQDVKRDATHEFNPEAVAFKRAALDAAPEQVGIPSDPTEAPRVQEPPPSMERVQPVPVDERRLSVKPEDDDARYRPLVKGERKVGGLEIMEGPIKNTDSIGATFDESEELPGLREVQLSEFKAAAKDNFYSKDDFDRVDNLAEQIRQSGKIAPLIVAIDAEGPYVLEGGHRLAALEKLGVKSFPALVVKDLSSDPKLSVGERKSATAPRPSEGVGIALDNVRKAFPTGKITEGEGAWDVVLPGNRRIRVNTTGDVEFSMADVRKGHPDAVGPDGQLKPGNRVVGSWQRIGRNGIVSLAKESGQSTLDHETFHAAMELVLSEKEKRAVLKKFKNEEAAADAYGAWSPADKSNHIFAKLAQFFQRIYRSLFPNADAVFGKVRTGEAFARKGAPYPDTPLPVPPLDAVPRVPEPPISRNDSSGKAENLNYPAAKDSSLKQPEFPPVTGRNMEKGEAPRVENRVDDLAAAVADAKVEEIPLERDSPQTWKSLEPEVRSVLKKYDEQEFFNIMKRRSLDAVETQAFDAVIKGKEERLERLKSEPRTSENETQIAAETLGYIAAQRAYINDGTGLARALAARARVMSAGNPAEAFARKVAPFKIPAKRAATLIQTFRKDPELLKMLRAEIEGGAKKLSVGEITPEQFEANLRKWFGESKVTNEDGSPLRVYHGAKADFSVFEPSRGGEYGSGIYFSDNPDTASMFGGWSRGEGGERLIPAYLRMENPLITESRDIPRGAGVKRLRAQGYDGIIGIGPTGQKQYVVFESTQVKSAIGNRGTFDPKNPDIRYSVESRSELLARMEAAGLDPAEAKALMEGLREDASVLDDLEAAVSGKPADSGDVLLKKVFKEIEGVSDEQAAQILEAFKENPDNLAPLLQSAIGHGKLKKVLEWWKAGLLSSFSTDVANISGNLAEHHIRLAETGVASGVDWLLQKVYGGDRARFAGEVGAEMAGANMALGPALKGLVSNLKDVVTLKDKPIDLNRRLEHQVGAIGGTTGKVVRAIGFGKLEVMDAFFKEWGGSAEAMKLAYRKAANELQAGSSKAEIKSRAKEIMAELQNPDNADHSDLLAEVEKKKELRTFQEKRPGSLTDAIAGVVRRNPMLSFVAPFINTPGNIANAIIKRSPLGAKQALQAYKEFRTAQQAFDAGKIDQAAFSEARGRFADAIAAPLLGTAMLAGFTLYANAGGMTGSGPTDEKAKQSLKDSGWSPYSFVFTDPTSGKKVYIPFNRFEPVSSLLGFAADMAEAKNVKNLSLFDKALGSIVENLTSKSYLTGLSDAASLISKPNQFAPQYIKSMTGSFVPNIIGRAAAAIDPTVRDTRASRTGLAGLPEAVGKNILSRIPFASQGLPARKTATGESAQRPGNALTRFASPVQPTIEKPEKFLEREYGRLGWAPSAPSRQATVKGVQLSLKDDEFRVMEKAAMRASDEARTLVRSSLYKSMPDDQREYALERIYAKWRTRGRQMIRGKLERRAQTELRA